MFSGPYLVSATAGRISGAHCSNVWAWWAWTWDGFPAPANDTSAGVRESLHDLFASTDNSFSGGFTPFISIAYQCFSTAIDSSDMRVSWSTRIILVHDLPNDNDIFILEVAGIRPSWPYEDPIWDMFMSAFVSHLGSSPR
ncbi:hypothetical protein BDR03DRAFT_1010356 [Suillus americanus]|nr:hypothetical protein BDR03DRAFT_1010356 [Suillus americanus]